MGRMGYRSSPAITCPSSPSRPSAHLVHEPPPDPEHSRELGYLIPGDVTCGLARQVAAFPEDRERFDSHLHQRPDVMCLGEGHIDPGLIEPKRSSAPALIAQFELQVKRAAPEGAEQVCP